MRASHFCSLELVAGQSHLGQRTEHVAGIRSRPGLDGDRERLLEQLERPLRVSEQMRQASEVVERLPDVDAVTELHEEIVGVLRVAPRLQPVPHPLVHERCLEVRIGGPSRVAAALRELDRKADVFTRRFEVARAAMTAGAPAEDIRPHPIARRLRGYRGRQRLAEQMLSPSPTPTACRRRRRAGTRSLRRWPCRRPAARAVRSPRPAAPAERAPSCRRRPRRGRASSRRPPSTTSATPSSSRKRRRVLTRIGEPSRFVDRPLRARSVGG